MRLLADGPDHELTIPTAVALDLQWLHRLGEAGDAGVSVDAVKALAFLGWTLGRVSI